MNVATQIYLQKYFQNIIKFLILELILLFEKILILIKEKIFPYMILQKMKKMEIL